ncbi:MAG: hypothetical protein KGZ93_02340 [Actinobacteria bacterium]|nr:hypothetical protein [Actinomycetota bacterium]
MLHKLLALFIVAMLMLPASALAAGKPDVAGEKSQSKVVDGNDSETKVKAESDAEETEKEDARPTQTDKRNSNTPTAGKPSSTSAPNEGSSDRAGSAADAGRAKGEEMKAKAEAIRAEKQVEAEAIRQTKKAEAEAIRAEKEALKDKKVAEAEAISTERQEEAKDGKIGLTRAMAAISTNITNVGGSAVKTLKMVYNKFASWLGLSLLDDSEEPADSEEGAELGGGEDTTSVEPDHGLDGAADTDTPELDSPDADKDTEAVEPNIETSN